MGRDAATTGALGSGALEAASEERDPWQRVRSVIVEGAAEAGGGGSRLHHVEAQGDEPGAVQTRHDGSGCGPRDLAPEGAGNLRLDLVVDEASALLEEGPSVVRAEDHPGLVE